MTQEFHIEDPWLDTTALQVGAASEAAPTGLQIATIEHVVPLDTQLGAAVKKTVPDALQDVLFGQPALTAAEIDAAGGNASKVPPMRTYAILDAAKITNLTELLEDSLLEHRCLFKGKAYDDLKNVAPWIMRLEDGNTFTRNLFTRSDAYWHLWDNQPGIYIRSRASLDDMWRHFRKFTKLQDEAGKWLYFRFWDPAGVANPLFDYMATRQEICAAWFSLLAGGQVNCYVYQTYKDGIVKYARLDDALRQIGPGRFSVYTNSQRDHGISYLLERRCYVMARRIKQEFAVDLVGLEIAQIQSRLLRCVERMRVYGIQQQEYVKSICIWDLLIGEKFEEKVGYERVMSILKSRKREPLKFDMLQNVMLEKQQVAVD